VSYAERVTSALPRDAVRNVVLVALVLAIAPVPVLGSSYYEGVLAHMVIFAMFAVALNIVFGQTDQLFLFMGGLAGIGGYGTALLADWTGISPWITLLISALVAALLGLVVSWISARRKFTVVLISILTLNLQLVLVEIYGGARDITRGSTGFPYEYLTFEGVAEAVGISEEVALYYFALLLLVGLLLVYVWLVNSRFGVAFHAIREDDLAASSIGIDVVRYKVVAGTVAAFAFGLVGAVYVQEANYILPADFAFLTVDVIVLIVLIVGGLRTTLGPVVGAAIVVAMEEILVSNFTQWRSAIFGLLLIFLFLYFRSGVVPAVADLVENLGALRGEPADEPTG